AARLRPLRRVARPDRRRLVLEGLVVPGDRQLLGPVVALWVPRRLVRRERVARPRLLGRRVARRDRQLVLRLVVLRGARRRRELGRPGQLV
ncbi:MAG TPA: hypothetical protein VFC19_52160, partial [Candidatus Limnocylindrales bacterium]|nr:hypothetical protein [Candidatus Limnocylindrales bacterium]